ncbi:hypothetical protein QBC43DRAFT_380556 [Cladorrhinum sp. PSN259]|nr:hypothetical protein QBC43DRAFT_380556 [Cladorrhinum sp. PSN259]
MSGSPAVKGYEGPGYQPIIPQSYEGCVFSPNSPIEFDLLTPNALPIVNRNGRAVEEADPTASTRFLAWDPTPPNVQAGLHDIRLSTQGSQPVLYLAVFQDGTVGWVGTSSNGQMPVMGPGGKKYITTIWSLQCNGIATSGIIGGIQLKYHIDDRGRIRWTGYLPPKNLPRDSDHSPPRDRKGDVEALGFFAKPRDNFEGLPKTGCSDDSIPVTKNPAVLPVTVNGCGPFDWWRLYFLPTLSMTFEEACNLHDVCWSTCGNLFEQCNIELLANLRTRCEAQFPTDGKALTGCINLAEIYFLRIMSRPSAYLFQAALAKYCDCQGTQLPIFPVQINP